MNDIASVVQKTVEKVSALQGEKADALAQLAAANDRVAERDLEIEELKRQIENKDAEIRQLNESLSERDQKVQAAEERLTQAVATLSTELQGLGVEFE
jgi:chromosome segregation ATPase